MSAACLGVQQRPKIPAFAGKHPHVHNAVCIVTTLSKHGRQSHVCRAVQVQWLHLVAGMWKQVCCTAHRMGQRSNSMWTVWRTHTGYALSCLSSAWLPLWATARYCPGRNPCIASCLRPLPTSVNIGMVYIDADRGLWQASHWRWGILLHDAARLLRRQSGASDRPMPSSEAVAFQAPPSLAVEVTLPHRGRVQGLALRKGVTLIGRCLQCLCSACLA